MMLIAEHSCKHSRQTWSLGAVPLAEGLPMEVLAAGTVTVQTLPRQDHSLGPGETSRFHAATSAEGWSCSMRRMVPTTERSTPCSAAVSPWAQGHTPLASAHRRYQRRPAARPTIEWLFGHSIESTAQGAHWCSLHCRERYPTAHYPPSAHPGAALQ